MEAGYIASGGGSWRYAWHREAAGMYPPAASVGVLLLARRAKGAAFLLLDRVDRVRHRVDHFPAFDAHLRRHGPNQTRERRVLTPRLDPWGREIPSRRTRQGLDYPSNARPQSDCHTKGRSPGGREGNSRPPGDKAGGRPTTPAALTISHRTAHETRFFFRDGGVNLRPSERLLLSQAEAPDLLRGG